MLQNACLLAKIGADTAENERNFAGHLPTIGTYPTGPLPPGPLSPTATPRRSGPRGAGGRPRRGAPRLGKKKRTFGKFLPCFSSFSSRHLVFVIKKFPYVDKHGYVLISKDSFPSTSFLIEFSDPTDYTAVRTSADCLEGRSSPSVPVKAARSARGARGGGCSGRGELRPPCSVIQLLCGDCLFMPASAGRVGLTRPAAAHQRLFSCILLQSTFLKGAGGALFCNEKSSRAPNRDRFEPSWLGQGHRRGGH